MCFDAWVIKCCVCVLRLGDNMLCILRLGDKMLYVCVVRLGDYNVRARSTAWSTAARSTAARSIVGETQAYDQGRSVQGRAPGSLGANWVPGPGPWPLGPR